MPQDALEELYEAIPQVIAQMPAEFTSHQFILKLARQNQRAYVKALYDCRNNQRRGHSVPFMKLHSGLATELGKYSDLVSRVDRISSVNIFGEHTDCVRWRRC